LDWLRRRLGGAERGLLCIMLANNETGVLQPIEEICEVAARFGWPTHVDAVQAAGKVAVDQARLSGASLAISAHKIGGPQGVGALISPRMVSSRQHGGGQERGRRCGTENGPGIAGFAAAARLARTDRSALERQTAWRDALAGRMAAFGGVTIGEGSRRLPQTLCVATPGFSSEVQVMALDLAGIMVSAGSACSSGKVKASPVVTAMGLANLAPFAIRITGGWATTESDWIRCGDAWLEAARRRAPVARQAA
ncbi:MAG: aminotransferase class V-fold PLP-dependent enzyme, partial [Caulobacteraceae bacterium]|nr:aminotransferase class V-fold PLP-dependent enzyme [Caulobacteraceae bacterium]